MAAALCARVPHRALLAITGAQSAQLLNGVLTTTVPWPAQGGFYSAFLHAQGRIQYDVFLWAIPHTEPQKSGYLVEYDPRPSEAPPLMTLLKRYVLRSKVRLQDASEEYDIWSAWNDKKAEPERRWRFGNRGAVEPLWDSIASWYGKDQRTIQDLRAVGMGERILVPKGGRPGQCDTHEEGTEDDYTVHRVMKGVPEGSIDLPPMQALAMNSNMDLIGGIDFRKGCYVGQELTVRTYHTGVIRRRIFPVQIHSADSQSRDPPSADSSIPAIPSMDIITEKNGLASPPGRRGTAPRLLTCLQGVGLASIRTQHVNAVERGELDMTVESDGVRYNVRHWVPNWWPIQSFEEDG